VSESSTSAEGVQYADLAYELLGGWLPDHIKGPDVVKAASDYAKGEYWGGFGLVMHYAAGVYGLYQAANPHADPYDRAEGGAAFVGHAAGAVAGLLESFRGAETVSAIGVEGAAGAASIVLGIVGAEAELFKWTLAKPLQDAAEASKESGRDWGSRLGFSAGILTPDHAWVKDHFLGVFLQPIPGEDEFGQLHREAFVHEFIESYREAQNMPASAAQAYRTCVVDVLAREHYVAPATPDQLEGLVWTLAHASDMARHACEGVATAIAADRDEFSGIFDMTAEAMAPMINMEADAAAVKSNLTQDAEASPGIPSAQAQGPASVAAHDEPATVGAPPGPAAPAGPTEVDNDGDGAADGTAAAHAAPAGPTEVDNDGDGAADGTAAAHAAPAGGDAHHGAAAAPDDPAHHAVMFGPPAPAGHHADQGAAASLLDPAHHAVMFGPPAPAGHHADQGAAASQFDASHGQSQNAAQQLSLQMYQQAQHVDQQTQHVHEPAHQQAYDHGGHGE
jgi:hypothetical protein